MELNNNDIEEFDINTIPFSLKPRVLIVDNDVSHFCSLGNLVHLCGYKVISCSGAEQGLRHLRHPIKYDVLMISVDMPNMNGLALLEIAVKEMDRLPVVIMMASEENKDDMFRSNYLGACAYTMKPVKEDFVRHMWQHVVRRRKDDISKKAKLPLPPLIASTYEAKKSRDQ